jgi:hypothetical protein
MKFVELIAENRLTEAKSFIFERLEQMIAARLEAKKVAVANDTYEWVEEELDEANVMRMGRITRIRRRIRRNAKGRIIVQKNVRKSAIKGYKLAGNRVVRIPTIQRLQKSRKLKRYWKTKGRAKLRRTLMKRSISLKRRKSMGIR